MFRDAVIDHAEHEETEEFTKLERNLTADDRGRMAKAVLAAEAIAPTRPHAGVESRQGQLHGRPVRVDARPGARRDRRSSPLVRLFSSQQPGHAAIRRVDIMCAEQCRRARGLGKR